MLHPQPSLTLIHTRSRKLHVVSALVLGDDTVSDNEAWIDPIRQTFGAKWGCKQPEDRANLLDFVLRAEGVQIDISSSMLLEAIQAIRSRKRVDNYGVCVDSLLLFAEACPPLAIDFFKTSLSEVCATMPTDYHGKPC